MNATTSNAIIQLATKHANGGSSQVGLADAIVLHQDGNYTYAASRALSSLRYSVGVLHDDYAKAVQLLPEMAK